MCPRRTGSGQPRKEKKERYLPGKSTYVRRGIADQTTPRYGKRGGDASVKEKASRVGRPRQSQKSISTAELSKVVGGKKGESVTGKTPSHCSEQ